MPERSTGSNAITDQSFDLLDVGKAPLVLARPDHLTVQANLETLPVTSGVSVTEASSSPNVASSSWAIQPALRPQPQSLQYVISIDGLFGMGSDASRDGCRDAKTSTIVPFEILCEAAYEPKTPSIPLDAMRRPRQGCATS